MVGFQRRRVLGMLTGAAIAPKAWADDAAALKADIPLLKRIYETLHPGLYRYQTPDQFTQRCADLEQALSRPLLLTQQYLKLSRLLAQVKCGHTYANFFNQSKSVAAQIIAPANKLPFHFKWVGARAVVTDNPLGLEGIRRGTEILSVNGVPVGQIQAALLPYIRADGSNDDKRRVLLNVQGVDRIETFDVFYPLVFPNDGSFTLSLLDGEGPARELKVAAIDQAQRAAMMPKGLDEKSAEYWSLTYPKPGVALMTMPGWALYDAGWDWKARLQAMFEEMATKGAKGLIIDIRDNEGGLDCGNEIIAHLIQADLHVLKDAERRVRFRSTPSDLNPYLDTWDRSFEHLGEGADDLGNGFYRLKAEDELRVISPKGPRFTGKVVVLSSAQNSSATFQFIRVMRQNRLARIYGQPTGGNQRGINGGSFFFVRLPNSGLECDLPLTGFFPLTPQPDAGLQPDVHIEPTVADIATGHDSVLSRAITDLS